MPTSFVNSPLLWFNGRLAYCRNSVLNVKAVVAASNQDKALVGAFSVIVQVQKYNITD